MMIHKKEAILSFLINDDEILLAESNYREGKITWNGISGYCDLKETPEEASIRELYEKIKVQVYKNDLEKAGIIHLYTLDENNLRQETLTITVFLCQKWLGTPRSTPGIYPQWFTFETIPYPDMFEDTETWLPKILKGDKLVIELFSQNNKQTGANEMKDILIRSLFA